MTPVELEANLDLTLRGDQGAAQRIIEHNKRLELINSDYELGKHADAQQVATLTAWLEIARDACNAWNLYAETLTQQLAQAQQDLADLPTLRKDLSMCLIQLQDARGRILSMESEVDMVRAMVRAQLDARRT